MSSTVVGFVSTFSGCLFAGRVKSLSMSSRSESR